MGKSDGSQKFRPKIQKTKNGEKWKMPISRAIFEADDQMWAQNFFDPKKSGLLELFIAYNIGPIRAREGLQKGPSKSPKSPSWVVAHAQKSPFKNRPYLENLLANPPILLAQSTYLGQIHRLNQ